MCPLLAIRKYGDGLGGYAVGVAAFDDEAVNCDNCRNSFHAPVLWKSRRPVVAHRPRFPPIALVSQSEGQTIIVEVLVAADSLFHSGKVSLNIFGCHDGGLNQ